MAKFYETLTDELREFLLAQHLFFVASAPRSDVGRINLSPKGLDSLRVLDDRTLAYLDLTGSGNETAAHVQENGRLTFMWCAFEGAPRILRAYCLGEVVLPDTPRWQELAPHFAPLPGARQLIVGHVRSVQTSCGFGVPLFEHRGARDTLLEWAEKKGEAGVADYRRQNNAFSIDGLPTPIGEAPG